MIRSPVSIFGENVLKTRITTFLSDKEAYHNLPTFRYLHLVYRTRLKRYKNIKNFLNPVV